MTETLLTIIIAWWLVEVFGEALWLLLGYALKYIVAPLAVLAAIVWLASICTVEILVGAWIVCFFVTAGLTITRAINGDSLNV